MLTRKCQQNIASDTRLGIEPNNHNINNEDEPQKYRQSSVETMAQIHSEIEHKTEMDYVYDITMLDLNEIDESLEGNACSHECSECSDTSSLSSDEDFEDSQNNNFDSSNAKKVNQDLDDLYPFYLNEIEINQREEEETITELVHVSNEKALLER